MKNLEKQNTKLIEKEIRFVVTGGAGVVQGRRNWRKVVKRYKLLHPKCPSIDEWIKKMWYIYTMEYYSAIKKKRH